MIHATVAARSDDNRATAVGRTSGTGRSGAAPAPGPAGTPRRRLDHHGFSPIFIGLSGGLPSVERSTAGGPTRPLATAG